MDGPAVCVCREGEREEGGERIEGRRSLRLDSYHMNKVLTADMRSVFSFHTGKGGDIQEGWGVGSGGWGRGVSGLGFSRMGLDHLLVGWCGMKVFALVTIPTGTRGEKVAADLPPSFTLRVISQLSMEIATTLSKRTISLTEKILAWLLLACTYTGPG